MLDIVEIIRIYKIMRFSLLKQYQSTRTDFEVMRELVEKKQQGAVYYVNGDVLEYSYTTFITRFARWDDYGSYLGNDADFNNDFSKVNTVRFKIGAEVQDEYLKRPFVIVLKKEGVLERTYDQFSTPEVSYSGYASFASTLTLADVGESGQYAVIKRYNFDKL